MNTQNWGDTLVRSFQELSDVVVTFLPNILMALVILLFGWVLGGILSKAVSRVVQVLKLDDALTSAGADELLEKANMKLNAGYFLGTLVKWFVIIAFLVASFDVLGLQQINTYLRDVVLGYIPQVIVAAIILLVSMALAGFVQKIVTGGAAAFGSETARFLGSLTKWAIWIFAFIVALAELGVAREFMFTLFTGFVAMFALAGGLAFGLGGRDSAARVLEKIGRDISRKE